MNRRNFILCLVLFCSVLVNCGGRTVTQPTTLREAENYTHDGMRAYAEADWSRAQWFFTRALSLYQGVDDQQGELHSHINLVETALSVRDFATTQKHLDRAAAMAKKPLLQPYQTRITLLYALNALQQKQVTQSENILHPLLPEFDGTTSVTIADTIQIAAIANRTQIAFVQKKDAELWTQRYANALESSGTNNPELKARLLRFQSSLLQSQGHYEEAEANLQQALADYKSSLYRPGIAATLAELGELYSTQGRWQDAQDFLNRSIAVFHSLGDLTKVIQVTESLVIVETELGNLQRSKALKQWLADMQDRQVNPLPPLPLEQ